MSTKSFNDDQFSSFYSSLGSIEYSIIKMYVNNRINTDGSLILENSNNLDKKDLWLYVYYLWQHNKHIDVFELMTHKNKASASLFIKVIRSTLDNNLQNSSIVDDLYNDYDLIIDKTDLINFIILIFEKYKNIKIPIIESIMDRIISTIDTDWKAMNNKNTINIDIVI